MPELARDQIGWQSRVFLQRQKNCNALKNNNKYARCVTHVARFNLQWCRHFLQMQGIAV